MENLITKEFGLKARDFQNLLFVTGGVVAGSAVLAAKTGLFVPNNLDIWVHCLPQVVTKDAMILKNSTILLYTLALEKQGYVKMKPGNPQEEGYSTGRLQSVVGLVESFKSQYSGKNIQVIYTWVPVQDAISSFDFDICRIYWEPLANFQHSLEETPMKSYHMASIENRLFSYLPDGALTEREKVRKAKYEARGFTYVDIQPVMHVPSCTHEVTV